MFDIRFTEPVELTDSADPADAGGEDWTPPAMRGDIVLGSHVEGFGSGIFFWQVGDDQRQWLDAVSRLVGGATKTALLTGVGDYALGYYWTMWPMYREGDTVFVQNHWLLLDTLAPPFRGGPIDDFVYPRGGGMMRTAIGRHLSGSFPLRIWRSF